jgi:sterol 14-demethylase
MFGNSDGTFRDVEYEEVKNMPVMDSCIREALRLVSLQYPAFNDVS